MIPRVRKDFIIPKFRVGRVEVGGGVLDVPYPNSQWITKNRSDGYRDILNESSKYNYSSVAYKGKRLWIYISWTHKEGE